MSKITLINPPSPFLIDQRVFPYLGILNVATAMINDGHNTQVVDLSGDVKWEDTIRGLKSADIFGVTSTSAQYKYVYRIGQLLRGKGKTVIGGTHVNNLVGTNDYKNIGDLDMFDVVFLGDGENYHPIIDGEGVVNGGIVKNIDDIPIPNRDFLDINSYHFSLDKRRATTILTQRGCPYPCSFCSGRNNEMYRKSRQHSPSRVAQEMGELERKFGFTGFMWFDDEININPDRLKEIAERIQGRNYRHRGFLRSDLLLKHPESLEYLKQMGFRELCLGVESGSDRILKLIKKGTTRALNLEAAKLIKDSGFKLKTFCMIGHPSETREDVEATRHFLLEAKPNGFDIAMLQPYPGSELYNSAISSNKFEGYEYEYKGLYFNRPIFSQQTSFHKGIPGTYHCHVRTDEMTADDITKLRDSLQKEIEYKLYK